MQSSLGHSGILAKSAAKHIFDKTELKVVLLSSFAKSLSFKQMGKAGHNFGKARGYGLWLWDDNNVMSVLVHPWRKAAVCFFCAAPKPVAHHGTFCDLFAYADAQAVV